MPIHFIPNAARVVMVLVVVLLPFASVPARANPGSPVAQGIRDNVERLVQGVTSEIDGVPVAAMDLIASIYEAREFQPLWTKSSDITDLLIEMERSAGEGLDPDDFHATRLLSMWSDLHKARSPDPGALADLDVLLTDGLARLGYQLFWGKVAAERLDADWNFERRMPFADPAATVIAAVESSEVPELIDRVRLHDPTYEQLKAALEEYRALAVAVEWPQMPAGKLLKPKMSDPRVPLLRARLGLPPAPEEVAEAYDSAVVMAVEGFQARHGLEADGILGEGTLAALNVSPVQRVEQIRATLERARWVLRDLPDEFIVVNIAGFRTYLIRDREIVWESPSIVGQPYRKTPIFRDEMSYLVLNPTWTIPPGIFAKDILPRLRDDPSYLGKKGYQLYSADGSPVDPRTVDWQAVRGMPYRVVQGPGAENALGRVKFMFPNKYFVYLHDTPSRGLFSRTGRALSSGCIRLENPLDLAERLLTPDPAWNRARMEKVIASGQTATVHLPRNVPVLLLYWTVDFDEDGELIFYEDVYDRDPPLIRALNSPFVPEPRAQAARPTN